MSDAPPTKVDVENALYWARSGDADAVTASAGVLAAEVERLRQVIREYVPHIESGERFDALVSVVPGLESDDGVYPTGEIDRLRQQLRHADECIAELDTALAPLCPCASLAMHDGPQQECPLHGDGKSFVAYVRELEQVKARARELTSVRLEPGGPDDQHDALYILGETQR